VRRPGLWIIVGLLLAAAGMAFASYGLRLGMHLQIWDPTRKTSEAVMGIGLGAALGGLVLAAIAWVVYRKREELRSGTGILARWRVGMLEWETFRRRDAARGGLFHSLRNRLRLPADLPPEGIEIRIGQNAMLVGDACYGLGYFASRGKLVDVARVDGQPAMLEFTTHQQGRNSSRLAVFRVPVPDGARIEAQAVLDHFDRAIDPERRDSLRSHYAPHFQAASGDAGEAEAARAEDRRRNWGAWGFSFLVVGGIILAILRWKAPGPNADLAAIRFLTIGGGILVAAGLLALAVSVLSRRQP
jgi:hypothetical protein